MIETFSDPLPADIHRLAERVMHAACAKSLAIATAESCTGGLLAAVLTDVEGCAHGFERGFVTYTEEAKAQVLGVARQTLDGSGAVSAPAAREMAQGALAASEADLALAVTGFAGPGGPGDEVGLVFLASARRGEPAQVKEHHYGEVSRAAVRLACLRDGLKMLEALL